MCCPKLLEALLALSMEDVEEDLTFTTSEVSISTELKLIEVIRVPMMEVPLHLAYTGTHYIRVHPTYVHNIVYTTAPRLSARLDESVPPPSISANRASSCSTRR